MLGVEDDIQPIAKRRKHNRFFDDLSDDELLGSEYDTVEPGVGETGLPDVDQGNLVCSSDPGDSECDRSEASRTSLSGTLCGFFDLESVPSVGSDSPKSVFSWTSGALLCCGRGQSGSSLADSERDGLVETTGACEGIQRDAVDDLGEFGDALPNTDSASFRLQGKSFHLTYRGHLGLDDCLAVWGGAGKCEFYSVCHEIGTHGKEEEAYPHTHVFVRLLKRVDKRGARCCDIGGVHPHIQKVSHKSHEERLYWLYHRKGNVGLWQSSKAPKDPTLYQDVAKLSERINTGSLLEACVRLGIEISSVTDVDRIRKERVPPEPARSEFSRDEFTLQLNWSHQWGGRIFDTCCIYLWGASGLGKTECAVAHFERGLLVRSLDQSRDFHATRYDGIIFDDSSLSHLSAEERIHLADYNYDAVIRARYSNGLLPAGTKRVFTSNKTPEDYWRGGTHMTDEQWEGIKRRVKFIHVIGKTYSN